MTTLAAPTRATDPRAWTAATLDESSAWYYPVPEAALPVFQRLREDLQRNPRPLAEARLSEAECAPLARALAPVLSALEEGRGFAVLQAPEDACAEEDLPVLYWVVGQGLGEPFAQNVQGTVLYDVRDTGQDVAQGARFSVTNAESSFHTDNSFGETVLDYVGLLCRRTALSGGVNQIVSGWTAYQELRERHPEALEVLSQPFHVDRRGGVREGQSPTAQIPVVEWTGEEPLFRYLRYWIHAGHDRAGQPMTSEQREALDLLDSILERPDLRAEFSLRPREMLFINNRWILHNRTAFEDHPEPELRRHYVRLWLTARR